MSIRCSFCGREYDVTLFEFEYVVKCDCGHIVSFQHKEISRELEEEKIQEIRRLADKIAFLIVSTDYSDIDIEIEKEKFRDKLKELFPDKAYLYELIYEPRFQRLKEQFKG